MNETARSLASVPEIGKESMTSWTCVCIHLLRDWYEWYGIGTNATTYVSFKAKPKFTSRYFNPWTLHVRLYTLSDFTSHLGIIVYLNFYESHRSRIESLLPCFVSLWAKLSSGRTRSHGCGGQIAARRSHHSRVVIMMLRHNIFYSLSTILTLLSALISHTLSVSPCDSLCNCSEVGDTGDFMVDCASRGLTSIPAEIPDITVIL